MSGYNYPNNTGMPQPQYGGTQGSGQANPGYGFNTPSGPGYPGQPGYNASSYPTGPNPAPSQPGYNPSAYPPQSGPTSQPGAPYPGQSGPPSQPGAPYPGQSGPPSQPKYTYPGQSAPPSQPGYGPSGGYPGQGGASSQPGYNPGGGGGGYQPPQSGPPSQPGYNSSSYPAPGGPPGQSGYNPGGYPPPQGGNPQPGYQPYASSGNTGYQQQNTPGAGSGYQQGSQPGYQPNAPTGNPYQQGSQSGPPSFGKGGSWGSSGVQQGHIAGTVGNHMDPYFQEAELGVAPGSQRGTLRPANGFDAKADCQSIIRAAKGAGTDEATIINVLGHRTADQRAAIANEFVMVDKRSIQQVLTSELSGNFESLCKMLVQTPVDLDVDMILRACEGAGTDETLLSLVLCTARTNSQIRALKAQFARRTQKGPDQYIRSELSSDYKSFLNGILSASRSDNLSVNMGQAKQDAELLYKKGEKKFGTDEKVFIDVFTTRSFPQLRATFDEYAKLTKKSKGIVGALDSELSGDFGKAMKIFAECTIDKAAGIAHLLEKTMKGMGTHDKQLQYLVVSRAEVDMVEVKQRFQSQTGKSLESWIKGDTSGDYGRLLLALVQG